jgi:Flp pilus assembly pilin Flp
MRSLSIFLKDDRGSTAVEFVVVFMAFIGIVFFVVEVALYSFFTASLEKAAEAGVRAAVVSSPAVNSPFDSTPPVPLVIRTDGGRYGANCSSSRARCINFPARSCAGSTCANQTTFTRVLTEMRRFNGRIQPGNVTVRYVDISSGIGFAGGPTVPMVTVTVSGVPFQTGLLGLLQPTLPPRSASMTGEYVAP